MNLALALAPVRQIPGGVVVRLLGIVSATVSVFVLLISQSRSAWLAACLVLVVLLIRSRRRLLPSFLVVAALLLFRVGLGYAGSARASSLDAIVALASQSALDRAPYCTGLPRSTS